MLLSVSEREKTIFLDRMYGIFMLVVACMHTHIAWGACTVSLSSGFKSRDAGSGLKIRDAVSGLKSRDAGPGYKSRDPGSGPCISPVPVGVVEPLDVVGGKWPLRVWLERANIDEFGGK